MAQSFYPILMTDKYVETINFYEDFFDFAVETETDTFTILRHKEHDKVRIAVVATEHEEIPTTHVKLVQGLILNFPVSDIVDAYERYYMKGLEIKTKPKLSPYGRRHFMVEDPNGVLIDVMQEYDPFYGTSEEDVEAQRFDALVGDLMTGTA